MAIPQRADLDFLSASRVVNLLDPVAAQEPATRSWTLAMIEGNSFKDAVRVASTANITLTAPGATIDAITMVSGDRFLAKNQTTTTENGIYVWTGAATLATRSLDADTFTELEAAVVGVEEGTSNSGTRWRQTAVNGVLGTNAVVWTADGTSAPAASETTQGIAEIATQAETDTGTDDLRIVTPLKLATWAGRLRKFVASIGDGSATSYAVTHNLNTLDVQVYAYENGGSKRQVQAEIQHTGVNSVTLIFSSAPTSAAIRVVVVS